MNIYDILVNTIDGETETLEKYRGKYLLVVNTASKCGFTPQYQGLESLYNIFKDKLVVLGFPSNQFKEQDPGDNKDIKSFCQLNYGVTFPLFQKTEVRGDNAHILFKYLSNAIPFAGFDTNDATQKKLKEITEQDYPQFLNDDSIKWNFTKFLINKDGTVLKRYEPWVTPEEIKNKLNDILK